MWPVLIILGALGFALSIRLLADGWDRRRIAEYVAGRGGRVTSIEWSPFGRGWFGEKSDRIYEVTYHDKDGLQHYATCKTSFFTGVYWTEDSIVGSRRNRAPDETASDLTALEAENRRLREEIERLKGQQH